MIKLWISSSKPFPSEKMKLKTTCCTSVPFLYSDKIAFFKLAWGKNSLDISTNQLQSHIEYLLLRLSLYPDLKILNHFTYFPLSCSMPAEPYEDKILKLIVPQEGRGLQFVLSSMDLFEVLTNKTFAILHEEK